MLITSSIKIFGYVTLFLIFLPFLLKEFRNIKNYIFDKSFFNNSILVYFGYFIFSTFLGAYYLKDLRIFIFWIPYFIVCLLAYYKNLYTLENNSFYRRNFLDIINISSIIYFVLYLVFNIFSFFYYGNFYQVQDNWWMGSSGAFHISSLLVVTNYINFKKDDYKISFRYIFSTLLLILITIINDSRLGVLYLIIFSLFTIFDSLINRKFIAGFFILSMIYFSFIGISPLVNNLKYLREDISQPSKEKVTSIKKDIKKSFKTKRFIEILITFDKFKISSFKDKIIGKGWYSSRFDLANFKDKYTEAHKRFLNDQLLSDRYSITASGAYSINGFQGLILDSGLIGFLYTLYMYSVTTKLILKQNNYNILSKTFFILILLLNLFCIFIGYSFVNIIFILFYLPKGILNNLISTNIKNK